VKTDKLLRILQNKQISNQRPVLFIQFAFEVDSSVLTPLGNTIVDSGSFGQCHCSAPAVRHYDKELLDRIQDFAHNTLCCLL